jgi:hypothetical protein
VSINPDAPILPEKDVALIPVYDAPYNPNDYPTAGTPPQTVDPLIDWQEVDINLLPGVPAQRGPTGPAGPTGVTGATGATGSSGVVSVTSPITNSGTSTSAIIGIDLTNIASTTFVNTAIANLVNSAPSTLDTLNELATALNNDPAFATTIATSIGLKAPLASPTFTGTVSGISKSMVGLSNVDNTSDLNKPISTATQTALDGKQATGSYLTSVPIASTSISGTVKVDGSTITINGSGVISGANTYSLPTASTSVLGGVKVDGSTITINGSGVISSSGGSGLPTTGGTMTGSLTLRQGGVGTAGTGPLYFNSGSGGTNILSAPVAGAIEYDGTAFYSTPNATTGRAVVPSSYYYVSDGSYFVDFSVTQTAKSIFGGNTVGLTLIAGTTYEFDLNVYTSTTTVGTASTAKNHSFLLTTVSGTPITTIYQQISTASSTTSFATASAVSTLRNINNAAVVVLPVVTAGTSRYVTYNTKGIIRVTGSGSVELSPAISSTGTDADYPFTALAGSYIKITPIGNGTVAGVGNWA